MARSQGVPFDGWSGNKLITLSGKSETPVIFFVLESTKSCDPFEGSNSFLKM